MNLQEVETSKEPIAGAVQESELKAPSLLDQASEGDLASYIRNVWDTNRRHKLTIQDRLIACLRARKGEYSPSQLSIITGQGGIDPPYIKLTSTKSRAASAWIRDVLMPAGDRPFAVEPTSIADLPTPLDNAIREKARQGAIELMTEGMMPKTEDAALEFISSVRDKAVKLTNDEARKRALRMEQRISDLMDEGGWDSSFEEFIEDFVVFPTAFLKGPYVTKKRTLKWNKDFTPNVTDEIVLSWRRVSPFDIFPSEFAKDLQSLDLIERLRYTPSQLFDLIGVPGYDEDRIREVLKDYEYGGLREWLWEDFEREQLESNSSFITDDKTTLDVLHYWGKVKGRLLKDWGYTAKSLDNEKSYDVDCLLIGNTVIKAVINTDPVGARPYHHACWDSIPGSIWGTALPEQMEDHQGMINGAARALANNMALASGPQVAVLTDMMAEGESVTTMHPFKVWQLRSSITGNSGDPIKFFQPDSNASELLKVMETFTTMADDVTNIPRYSYGNERIGGAGATATGLSMLMNSAAKGIRRAIANIDANIIRPSVWQAFMYVMLYDEDTTLKGDCKIVPRGASALLIKEQNLTRIQTFLGQITNPVDAQIIDLPRRAKLLREVVRMLDLPEDVVPSEQELVVAAEMMKAQGAPPSGGPPQPPSPQTAGGDQSINQLQSNLGAQG